MRTRFLVAAAFLLNARVYGQANTLPGNAANFQWGQKLTTFENGTTTQTWWRGAVRSGRSYCAETGNVEGTSNADKFVDTVIDVYRGDASTLVVHNDDATSEPYADNYSRACWIGVANEVYFVKLTPYSLGTSASNISIRFVETTLYCPWFFIAGDYNAFSLIRNTGDSPLPGVVVTWRDLGGAAAGTTTVAIPANGTVILNARDYVNPALTSNGSIEIAHVGAVDRLKGSTTTLSGTTGLGFDALFEQRKIW
jgi:hypothetical protein